MDLAAEETKQLALHGLRHQVPHRWANNRSCLSRPVIWRYEVMQAKPRLCRSTSKRLRRRAADWWKMRLSILDSQLADSERTIVDDLFQSRLGGDGTPRVWARLQAGAHERDAVWSPDGKWIAYNSDATGENELYVRSQDGKGDPQQITDGGDTYCTPVVLDGKSCSGAIACSSCAMSMCVQGRDRSTKDKFGETRVITGRRQSVDRLGAARRKRHARVYLLAREQTADRRHR